MFGDIAHYANGIDLRADTFGIELKTRMRTFTLKNGTIHHCHGQFTLHDEQLEMFREVYSSQFELFLCLLRYDFARPVRSLKKDQHDVEGLISGREAWFVPWVFTDSYPVSPLPLQVRIAICLFVTLWLMPRNRTFVCLLALGRSYMFPARLS